MSRVCSNIVHLLKFHKRSRVKVSPNGFTNSLLCEFNSGEEYTVWEYTRHKFKSAYCRLAWMFALCGRFISCHSVNINDKRGLSDTGFTFTLSLQSENSPVLFGSTSSPVLFGKMVARRLEMRKKQFSRCEPVWIDIGVHEFAYRHTYILHTPHCWRIHRRNL